MTDLRERLQSGLTDRYLLERELGHGGMATVFLARDLRHDRPVALKVMHPDLAARLGPERFQREIRVAARLQHPHILGVHDSGEAAGRLWFTMPYVEGESLRERLRGQRQLPLDEALRIAREACQALQYAHDHGVVHRDIKPENILLTHDGNTLVADFGIARALGGTAEEALTETGMALGTVAYMSPEQASGERELDGRTDLYSLGCVLYEMLAGEPPYTGSTAQAIIAKRLSEPIPHLRTLREVPEQVERAVTKALARAAADRFPTAAEFSAALAAWPARPHSRFSGLRGVSAVGGVLLLLAGLGWWAAVGRTSPAAPAEAGAGKSIAVLPFVNMSADKENEYFSDGMTEELITELSRVGRQLKVGTVLEGSVRKAGEQLRITAQLIDTRNGYHIWSDAYQRDVRDVFAVQAELSRAIAEALQVRLRPDQRAPSSTRPRADPAAYDLCLRGRHAWHMRTAEGVAQARELFEQAIAADPGFAQAYAGLADAYTVLPLWSDVPPDQAYPRAKAAALQALSLDSTLAEPYAALADGQSSYEWDWAAAERGFKRALALDPNSANTLHFYASSFLVAVGRMEEAVELERRASDLDPLSPNINATVGWTLYMARRYREARTHLEAARTMEPDFTLGNFFLGEVELIEGKHSDAVRVMEHGVDPKVRHSIDLGFLGHAYAKAGRRRDAERLLRELEHRDERGYISSVSMALLHVGLGDTVQALGYVERAADERDPFLAIHFTSDPIFDGLRNSPRGQAVLKRMGLTPAVSPSE